MDSIIESVEKLTAQRQETLLEMQKAQRELAGIALSNRQSALQSRLMQIDFAILHAESTAAKSP